MQRQLHHMRLCVLLLLAACAHARFTYQDLSSPNDGISGFSISGSFDSAESNMWAEGATDVGIDQIMGDLDFSSVHLSNSHQTSTTHFTDSLFDTLFARAFPTPSRRNAVTSPLVDDFLTDDSSSYTRGWDASSDIAADPAVSDGWQGSYSSGQVLRSVGPAELFRQLSQARFAPQRYRVYLVPVVESVDEGPTMEDLLHALNEEIDWSEPQPSIEPYEEVTFTNDMLDVSPSMDASDLRMEVEAVFDEPYEYEVSEPEFESYIYDSDGYYSGYDDALYEEPYGARMAQDAIGAAGDELYFSSDSHYATGFESDSDYAHQLPASSHTFDDVSNQGYHFSGYDNGVSSPARYPDSDSDYAHQLSATKPFRLPYRPDMQSDGYTGEFEDFSDGDGVWSRLCAGTNWWSVLIFAAVVLVWACVLAEYLFNQSSWGTRLTTMGMHKADPLADDAEGDTKAPLLSGEYDGVEAADVYRAYTLKVQHARDHAEDSNDESTLKAFSPA